MRSRNGEWCHVPVSGNMNKDVETVFVHGIPGEWLSCWLNAKRLKSGGIVGNQDREGGVCGILGVLGWGNSGWFSRQWRAIDGFWVGEWYYWSSHLEDWYDSGAEYVLPWRWMGVGETENLLL